MSNIGSVSSRERSFGDDELDAMRKDEATTAIVNKARRDAGFKEADVTVRGDDRTLAQVQHDGQTYIGRGEAALGVLHGIEIAEAVGVGGESMHALGAVPHVVIPALTLIAVHGAMYEMERKKAELKDGATRDQLHAAIVFTLDVPKGFRESELQRLGVTVTNQNAAGKISDQFGLKDKAQLATLQLHCDQGMHSARSMIDAGQSKDAFLEANPEVAKRYAGDVAFRNGFDALTWTKTNAPAAYDAETKKLESRDARYDAAHVSYRI